MRRDKLTGRLPTAFVAVICFCSLSVFTGLAGAQGGEGAGALPLTLQDAIALAVEGNPALQAAGYRLDGAEAKIVQARSGRFPQVYLSEIINRTTNPMWAFGTRLNQGTISQDDFDPRQLNDPEAIDNFATAVKVEWPVYTGGRIPLGIRQAETNRDAVTHAEEMTRQQIIAQTAKAYVGLLLAMENRVVVKKALETATAHLKIIQSRFNSGFAVKSDLLRAKVRIAELDQAVLQSYSGVEVARAVLNAAMGIPDDRAFDPVSSFTRYLETSGTAGEWIDIALTRRLELKQLSALEAAAKDEIAKSKAEHLPSFSLMGAYEINTEDFGDFASNYTVGAIARVNIFSGLRISAKITEAETALRQVMAEKDSLTLLVGVQTRQAFLEAQSAWRQIEVARAAVAQAEEGLRIVRNRYRNGLLTIVSLLDAAVAHQEAQTRHFRTLHDCKVARINLYLATGTMDLDFQ